MSIGTYSKTTSKGTHTMPEEVRLLLQVKPGDQIYYKDVDVENNEAVIEVIHTKNVVEELGGSLHDPKVKYIPIDLARKQAAQKYGHKNY